LDGGQTAGLAAGRDTEAIGDGAPWIWHQMALHFPASRELIDGYHAKQHLVLVARLLKGDNDLAYQRWLDSRETALH
jgi:hypothetical protein